jgi:7-cyano-7-deazaguanine synthase
MEVDAVLLLSGGLDSAVLLAKLLDEGIKLYSITFAYGQSHETRETLAAQKVASHYKVSQELIVLPRAVFTGSALTGRGTVPTGVPPDDPTQSQTVVPGRNLVFLAVAVAKAVQLGAERVLIGANASDERVYPDCRWAFIRAAGSASGEGYGVQVQAPFLSMVKRQIVELGKSLKTPLEMTWSCYVGNEQPCGKCGACITRIVAGG